MRRTAKQMLVGGLLCTTLLGLSGSIPESLRPFGGVIEAQAAETFSQFWFQDEQGNWKVKDQTGNVITNAWLCDDAVTANGQEVWYLLDADGNLITAGLVQDQTGNFYSIEMNHDGYYGMLRYKSQVYDDVNLTLESRHEGSFAKILNADGVQALQAKYGLTAVAISNDNCVYTSSFTTNAGTGASTASKGGSGGGGGGGGGSSSSGSSSITYEYDEDSEWENYSDSSVSRAANDFTSGNYGMMTAAQRQEMDAAIAEFKAEYITSGMSDFEKEIKIIEWLVDGCYYERGDGWENATAYSCIVNGRAQCSGYADAFLQTAKACGIEARYVHNNIHAWNLVKLDGDWYHVDVTWEDPVGSNSYGFGNLRNAYINLEDSRVQGISAHRTWSPSSTKATGIKYGPRVVKKYLKDGTIDTSLGISFKDQTDKFFASVRNEDGSNIISYTSTDEMVNQIVAYISRQIDERQSSFEFVTRYGSAYPATVSGNYSKVLQLNNQIEEKVNTAINNKYKEVLRNELKISLYLQSDANAEYYCHRTGNLHYQEGQNLQVPYTLHLMCDGQEIATQTGTAERNASVEINFPENYSWISNSKENYTVMKGEGHYSGKTFRVTGRTEFEMSVKVRNRTQVGYTVEYIDQDTKAVLDTVSGSGSIGGSITLEEKTFDGYLPVKNQMTVTLRNSSVSNHFTYPYAKECSYTVQYICDTDGEILDEVSGRGAKGTHLTIPKRSFDGHTQKNGQTFEHKLTEDTAVYQIHYTHTLNSATFTYTVKFVDMDGNELGSGTQQGQENSTITIPEKTFSGYKRVEGQTLKYKLTENNMTFTIKYAEQCSYYVSYRRNDQSTETEFERGNTVTVAKGSKVTIKSKKFDGLEYVSGAETYEVTENNTVFVVYYKEKTASSAQKQKAASEKKKASEEADEETDEKTESIDEKVNLHEDSTAESPETADASEAADEKENADSQPEETFS